MISMLIYSRILYCNDLEKRFGRYFGFAFARAFGCIDIATLP